jgi:hypothetical protein
MSLITNTIKVRGKDYLVSEMDGKTMAEVRKRLASDSEKIGLEAFMAFKCCLDPKFASSEAAAAESHFVSKAISDEAFRLTASDGEEKNA